MNLQFLAGGQFVQRYVGFAEVRRPHSFPVRYVVAEPGSWLYFDPERPVPLRQGAAVDWDDCLDGLSASGSEGACTLHWRPPARLVRLKTAGSTAPKRCRQT